MKISYNWLKTYFSKQNRKDLPNGESLAELLTFHFSEVESLENIGKGDDFDIIFDIKILPDRAHYSLSHRGVARELSMLSGIPLLKDRIPQPPKPDIDNKINVIIKDNDFCKRYIARIVENIDIKESSSWMRTLLESIDARSINSIVDGTNMIMFDTGQPMHVFDMDKVRGDIVVRSAKSGEKITLLDEREITLNTEDYVIADEKGPLAIAGVKGGKRAEVTNATKNIIIESANFDPIKVRKTSIRHNIRNESSKRFENEISPEMALEAMDNMSALIKEIYGQAKFGPIVDIYKNKVNQSIIKINPIYIKESLGLDIPNEEIKNILNKLSITIEDSGKKWKLTIPFERIDLSIPEDIVEEVGRIYGYEKIKSVLPMQSNIAPLVPSSFYIKERIRSILYELGFSEVYTYSFTSQGYYEIEKPLASDKSHIRTNITLNIIKSLDLNAKNRDLLGLDEIKIFEIGKVFTKEGEHTSLCIGIRNIKKKQEKENEKIKKIRDELFEKLGIKAKILCTADDTGGIISLGGKTIGITNNTEGIMEINIDMITQTLSKDISISELSFQKIPNIHYKQFSLYPFIIRDVAIFVPESIREEYVWSKINTALELAHVRHLLVRHSLFDVFKKDGKTSYAFRLIFQAMDRTLTDIETNKIMDKVHEILKKNDWQVR